LATRSEESGYLFPTVKDIPKRFVLPHPIVNVRYLVGGSLKSWDGPTEEVFSPIWVEGPIGPGPLKLGSHPLVNETTALEALDAACHAFDEGKGVWPSLSATRRIEHVEAFVSAMKQKKSQIARLIMWEIGKTYDDAIKEFDRTVAYIRGTITALRRQERKANRTVCEQGIVGRTRRAPLGVALCMGPFNYPLYETFTFVAPALLTGNTVIFKPPRYGSLIFATLLEALCDAFPPGVVNLIFGEARRIIPPLIRSGRVDVLAFIGTKHIADQLKGFHPRPQRLTSILGLEAKNPAIILHDADLNVTVRESVMGALGFNGQRCAALKIFFVHRSIVEDFLKGMSHEMEKLKSGMPWEKNTFITPLIEPDRAAYLTQLVQDATRLGAKILRGSHPDRNLRLYEPAILYPVSKNMRIYHEEQFGPLIPVVPYDDIEEPLRYVSASGYGQQASVFGRDAEALATLVNHLSHQVSRININCKCQRTPDEFPFTGRKDSAQGVLSISEALLAFTTPLCITTRNTAPDSGLFFNVTGEKTPV